MVDQIKQSRPGQMYVPAWDGERIVPRRVVIETVYGCNARCGMCPISQDAVRPQGVMPWDGFCRLVDALLPHKEQIDMVDLFGLGEPLLDPQLCDRVAYLKRHGFRRLAISTNAQLLTPDRARAVLATGIETIIVSIDGLSAATHEAIRRRTRFERVRAQTEAAVAVRDQLNAPTRFILRFIHQPINAHEWAGYRRHWASVLSPDRGDRIERYDMHDWSGQVGGAGNGGGEGAHKDHWIGDMACHHVFEKMVVLSDGSMSLCFEDIYAAQFGLGNVFEDDAIDLFNSARFNKLRRIHAGGKRRNLRLCRDCAVLESEVAREAGSGVAA